MYSNYETPNLLLLFLLILKAFIFLNSKSYLFDTTLHLDLNLYWNFLVLGFLQGGHSYRLINLNFSFIVKNGTQIVSWNFTYLEKLHDLNFSVRSNRFENLEFFCFTFKIFFKIMFKLYRVFLLIKILGIFSIKKTVG